MHDCVWLNYSPILATQFLSVPVPGRTFLSRDQPLASSSNSVWKPTDNFPYLGADMINLVHVDMTNKYRICRCPRVFSAVFRINCKRAGNIVTLFSFDNGFCWLDCFCCRMNNWRITEFGLRRISELFRIIDLGLSNSYILLSLSQ